MSLLQLDMEDQQVLKQWLARADDIISFMLQCTVRFFFFHDSPVTHAIHETHKSIHCQPCKPSALIHNHHGPTAPIWDQLGANRQSSVHANSFNQSSAPMGNPAPNEPSHELIAVICHGTQLLSCVIWTTCCHMLCQPSITLSFVNQLTRLTKLQTCASGIEKPIATSLDPFTCFLFAYTHKQIQLLR